MPSLLSSMEPERESKAASAPTVYVLEQELYIFKQELINLISSANDARNSSDPSVLMSLSEDLGVAADNFLDAGHAFIAARKRAGYVSTKESIESIYHDATEAM